MSSINHKEHVKMHQKNFSLRFVKFSRWLHKWIGIAIFSVLIVLAITGGFVAFKNKFEYLQPSTRTSEKGHIDEILSPSQISKIIFNMKLPDVSTVDKINRIEYRPSKRTYKVRLESANTWESPREIQIDAISGRVLNDGLRGDQLWMDIHSFAIFGNLTKMIVMSFMSISILWLCVSGVYLFFYPIWFKHTKRHK